MTGNRCLRWWLWRCWWGGGPGGCRLGKRMKRIAGRSLVAAAVAVAAYVLEMAAVAASAVVAVVVAAAAEVVDVVADEVVAFAVAAATSVGQRTFVRMVAGDHSDGGAGIYWAEEHRACCKS